ncbi:MAG: glutamate racemase [Bacteroidetes bacterium]|nr:glutamate racemase [Bacteroidota bacterium]
MQPLSKGPIGVFDSGYGGLTVLRDLVAALPEYDYCYLGDSARAPYGNRSFATVYKYTLQCVQWFFKQGCPLVILACNTASAKALRTIQQNDLPKMAPHNRVLGVIRPTAEVIGQYTKKGKVGVLATQGTVDPLEIAKFFPDLTVFQEACPMWVPLIENNEHLSEGADFFVKKHVEAILKKDKDIDTLLLACTHYPLLRPVIEKHLPKSVRLISQGEIVAASLANYLDRHSEISERCTRKGELKFFTTDSAPDFDAQAAQFFGAPVRAYTVNLAGTVI